MHRKIGLLSVALVLLLGGVTTFAHHPVDGEYDRAKFVSLTGTITKVEWMNPHSKIQVEVKDPDGRASSWTLELEGSDMMTKSGFTRDSFKQGDRVEAGVWLAKDGSLRAHADSIMMTRRLTTSAAPASRGN